MPLTIDSPFILPVACAAAIYVLLFVWRQISSPLKAVPGPHLARFTDAWYFWKAQLYVTARIVTASATPKQQEPSTALRRRSPSHDGIQHSGRSTSGPSSPTMTQTDMRKTGGSIRRLAELANTNVHTNMGHLMQCYAFDVIGLMTYSKRIGFLDRGEDIGGVMGALEDMVYYASLAGLIPSCHPYIFRVKNWLSGKKGVGRAYVVEFTKERVAEHQARPKAEPVDGKEDIDYTKKLDFLSKFHARHTKEPDSFTAYHVIAGCTHNMVAGSDTTGITLSACLYYLLKHPQSLAKLQAEVNGLLSDGRMIRHVSWKESQEMPYLQAVIKETLRLHPATGLPLERIVPKGGATICDKFFPEGTIVGVNTWVAHRNPQIWGDDADEYKPERWFVDDSDKLAFMNRHWIPFGQGSRTCIGRHISMLEVSKLIASIVGDFDFEIDPRLAHPTTEWKTANYWFVKPKDFMVRVKLRGTQGSF